MPRAHSWINLALAVVILALAIVVYAATPRREAVYATSGTSSAASLSCGGSRLGEAAHGSQNDHAAATCQER